MSLLSDGDSKTAERSHRSSPALLVPRGLHLSLPPLSSFTLRYSHKVFAFAASAASCCCSREGQASHDGWTQCHYRGMVPRSRVYLVFHIKNSINLFVVTATDASAASACTRPTGSNDASSRPTVTWRITSKLDGSLRPLGAVQLPGWWARRPPWHTTSFIIVCVHQGSSRWEVVRKWCVIHFRCYILLLIIRSPQWCHLVWRYTTGLEWILIWHIHIIAFDWNFHFWF